MDSPLDTQLIVPAQHSTSYVLPVSPPDSESPPAAPQWGFVFYSVPQPPGTQDFNVPLNPREKTSVLEQLPLWERELGDSHA